MADVEPRNSALEQLLRMFTYKGKTILPEGSGISRNLKIHVDPGDTIDHRIREQIQSIPNVGKEPRKTMQLGPEASTLGFGTSADYTNASRIMDSLRQHGNSIVESIPWPTLPSARKDPERIEATKIGIDAAGAIGFTSPLAMQDKLYQIVKDMAVDPYIRLGAKNLIDEIERKGVSENTIDRIVDIKGIYGHHGGGEFLPIPPQRKSGGVELTEGMRNWAQLSRNQQLYTDEGRKTVGSLDVPSYVVYDPKYKYSDKANLIPHEVGHGEAAYNSKMPEADLLERIYSQYNPGSVYASMATASKGGSQGDFLRNVGGLHYAKPSEQLAQLFANRVSGGKMYLEDIHVPEDARVTTDLAKKMWARPPGDYTFMDALNEYKQLRTTRPVDAYIQPSPSGIPILDDWYKYLYERKK